MMDTDLQLRHMDARARHDDRQKAAGFRHAAAAIMADLPRGVLQEEAARRVADRLVHDAAVLEERADRHAGVTLT